MGVWNFIKRVVSAPRHIVAKAVETIGDILSESNSKIIYETGWALQTIGENMNPKCYREEIATSKDVVDINVICKEYYIESSEKINNHILPLIMEAENVIDEIKNQTILLVPDDVFQQVKNAISKEAFDTIKKDACDIISEKISISNEEFKNILSISSDNERKEKCKSYIAKLMEQTLNDSVDRINLTKNIIIENMIAEINEYLNQVESDLKVTQEEQAEFYSKKDDIEYVIKCFSEKTVDLAYLNCIISTTDNI